MRSVLAATVLFGCCLSISARAEWLASRNGPDVFGTVTVVATAVERMSDSLIVQCTPGDQLEIAYIMRSQQEVGDAPLTGQLLIQGSSGKPPMKLDAELKKWNDDYIGFVASGRTPEIVAVVKAIGDSTGSINIGIAVAGHHFTASFSASGSTAAMNTVVKDCKLGDIAPSAPAAPTG